MKTLEECKIKWTEAQNDLPKEQSYKEMDLERIFKSRVAGHVKEAMKYFWASFVFQIIVYSLISHAIVKYWSDKETVLLGIGAILLYVPFTVVLMKKFRQIANTSFDKQVDKGASMHQFAMHQRDLLQSFYSFKRAYEFVLIPLSAVIGIIITFRLYVPGGVSAHPVGAVITFIITMASCIAAIISENRKSFKQPIRNLQDILGEFKNEA